MAQIGKLPLKDVRYLADQLIHSYGGLAELAQKHPWIKEYSQEVVREVYGDEFNAWRYITLRGKTKIEPEKIVSLTGNPAWIFYATSTAPGMYWATDPLTRENTMIAVEHAILKYRLPVERVIFYVPAIIDVAIDTFGDSLGKWIVRPERRSPMSIRKVFNTILDDREEEIVADVTGLEPEVIDFREKEDNWWWNKHLAADIAGDRVDDVEVFVADILKRGQLIPNEEWTVEKIRDYFRDAYKRLEEFFAP